MMNLQPNLNSIHWAQTQPLKHREAEVELYLRRMHNQSCSIYFVQCVIILVRSCRLEVLLEALTRDWETWWEEVEEDLSSVVPSAGRTYFVISEHVRYFMGIYGLVYCLLLYKTWCNAHVKGFARSPFGWSINSAASLCDLAYFSYPFPLAKNTKISPPTKWKSKAFVASSEFRTVFTFELRLGSAQISPSLWVSSQILHHRRPTGERDQERTTRLTGSTPTRILIFWSVALPSEVLSTATGTLLNAPPLHLLPKVASRICPPRLAQELERWSCKRVSLLRPV